MGLVASIVNNFDPLGIFIFSGLQEFIVARKIAVEVNLEKSNQTRNLFKLIGFQDKAYRDSKIFFTLIINFSVFVIYLGLFFLTKTLI